MEESAALITSIHTSMTTWFTPTVLFIFLNLMIATILFTSNLPTNNPTKPQQQSPNPNDTVQSKLTRSPSILHRLKSFTLYQQHRSQDDEPSLTTNHHEQQEEEDALEIAATQYVFSHPFTHEQDLQPVSSTVKRFGFDPTHFDFDPTRIDKEASPVESFTHQDLQLDRANPKRFDFDPAQIEREAQPVNESIIHDQDSTPVSTNLKRSDFDQTHVDFDPTRIGKGAPLDMEPDFMDTHDEETDDFDSLDEIYSKITGRHVNRTKSDTVPASGEVPVKLPAKMKKSASTKSAFAHFEEDKIVEARRPATVRERRTVAENDDVEVDAKADDFINKFKHQLKLQRLDSIVRYKDMVNRGGGK